MASNSSKPLPGFNRSCPPEVFISDRKSQTTNSPMPILAFASQKKFPDSRSDKQSSLKMALSSQWKLLRERTNALPVAANSPEKTVAQLPSRLRVKITIYVSISPASDRKPSKPATTLAFPSSLSKRENPSCSNSKLVNRLQRKIRSP